MSHPAKCFMLSNLIAVRGLCGALVGLLGVCTADAATYYWDCNNGTAGFGSAQGVWSATTIGATNYGWSTSAKGTTAVSGNTVTTTTNDTVTFGTVTNNLGGGTITVAGAVSAGNLALYGAGNLVFAGGTAINLATNATFTLGGGKTYNFATPLAGGALTVAGSGVLELSGSNTYAGDMTVSNGTLQFGANNVLPNGGGFGNVAVNGTLDLNGFSGTINGLNGTGVVDNALAGSSATLTAGGNNAAGTFGGVLQNSGSGATLALVKVGSGVLTLTGSNTYTGATTISAGTLQLGNGTAGNDGSLASPQITNSGALSFNLYGNSSYAGSISGSGGFSKSGGGILVLSGANSYAGQTSVNGGELDFNNWAAGAAQGSVKIDNATVGIGNGYATPSGGVLFWIGYHAGTTSVVNQTGGVFIPNGFGIFIGNGINSQGAYNLSGGTVSNSNLGIVIGVARGNGSTGSLNVGGTGTVSMGGLGLASAVAVTNATAMYNQTGGSAAFKNLYVGGTAGVANTLSLNLTGGALAATNIASFVAEASSTATLNLGGSAQVSLGAFPVPAGAASLTFDFTTGWLAPVSATNAYLSGLTGAFLTTNGANFNVASNISITVAQALQDAPGQAGRLQKSGAGVLTLTGSNTYTGPTVISGGTLNLNIVGNQTYGGGVSGAGALTKSGAGTLFPFGANTYTGPTTISAGELKFSTGGSATPAVTVAGGATNGVLVAGPNGRWTTGNLTNSSGSTLDISYGGYAPSTTVAPVAVSNLSLGTGLTLRVGGAQFAAGQNYPLMAWSSSGPANASAFTQLVLPNQVVGNLSVAGQTLYLNVTSVGANTGSLSWNTGDGVWDTSTTNWVDAALTPSAYEDGVDTVVFGDAAGASGNPLVTVNVPLTPADVTMLSSNHDYTLAGAGGIGGDAVFALDAANTRTLTVLNTNRASGGALVNGGQLQLGNGVAQGVMAGPLVINAALLVTNNAAQTLTNPVSGGGTFTKAGSGALTLTGMNTFSGATMVAGGALLVNGALGGGNVVVSGANSLLGGTGSIGGTLTVTNGGSLQPTLAGAGGGTLTLAGATGPNFAPGSTLKLRAPSSAVDQVVLSDGNAVFDSANLNLVIDATGLVGNLTNVTLVSVAKPAGGINGAFASVTATACAVTVHYNAQSITADLQPWRATQLAFTSPAFTNLLDLMSFLPGTVTVQRQDANGNPVTNDPAITVNFSSSTTGTATFNPPVLTFTNDASDATFTYQDTQAGSPVLTASVSGLTSASQTETITTLAARKLAALTNEFNAPWPGPVPGNTWGESEYCVAAYTLNQGLSTADAYVLGWNNTNEMLLDNTSDLSSANPVRIFADPVLFGRMSYAAQTNLQTIMWNYLNANSRVADTTNVWDIVGSENHNLSQRGPYYLIAQTLAQTPGYTNRVLSDGYTIQQHAAAWAAYFRNYFWSRARKGLEIEINSPTYTKYSLSSYYNVYDLTTDPVVNANASNYLNLYWAEKAQNFLPANATVGGSRTRCYKSALTDEAFTGADYNLGWNNIGYSGHPADQMELVTSYQCPATISALALLPKGRYLAEHNSWGESLPAPNGYDNVGFEADGSGGVVRLNYSTEAYVMSATCYRPDRTFFGGVQQNRMMGVIFNSGQDRIAVIGDGTAQGQGTDYASVNGVAGTNCVILFRDPQASSSAGQYVFFSAGTMSNNLVKVGNWWFTQTTNAYAAIRVANKSWTIGTDTNVPGGMVAKLGDMWSPVIIECAPKTDYASFAAFQNRIATNAFSTNSAAGASYSVSYTSTAGEPFVVYANSTNFPKMHGTNFAYELPQTYVSSYLNGLGINDTGTVSYPGFPDVTLTFLTNSAPVLAPITNYTLMAGQTLQFTNTVTDANVPKLALTYALPQAPAGAAVNATNGVFIWRPAVAQTATTNVITVVVTGNNTPALSATQSFTVIVPPVAVPVLGALTFSNGVLGVRVTGSAGPDYSLQASTNLLDWQTVLTTNAAPPFSLQDQAGTNYPRRFYRVRLGP